VAAEPSEFSAPARWIGARTGVLIYSRQERAFWDLAVRTARIGGLTFSRKVEVNDCAQAYHLAADGVGLSPCVITPACRFAAHVVEDAPALPPVRFAVRTQDAAVARCLQSHFNAGAVQLAV
jgi:hypothetical protein